MSEILVLTEIDAYGSVPDGDIWPTLTRCDSCYESVVDDFMAGKEPRRFYWIENEELNLCEHCVESGGES